MVENGGRVVSFGGSTNVLLVSSTGKASTKIDKAKAKGIPVMTWDAFTKSTVFKGDKRWLYDRTWFHHCLRVLS